MLGWKVFGSGIPGLAVQAICQDAATSISAAGTTQATATELVNADSDVTTVAANAGVILSSKGSAGDEQSVFNAGANPLNIYPPVGMSINALTVNLPMILPKNTGCIFKFVSTTRVFGILSQ